MTPLATTAARGVVSGLVTGRLEDRLRPRTAHSLIANADGSGSPTPVDIGDLAISIGAPRMGAGCRRATADEPGDTAAPDTTITKAPEEEVEEEAGDPRVQLHRARAIDASSARSTASRSRPARRR